MRRKLGRLIGAFAKVALLGLLLVPGFPDHVYAQLAVQELVSIPRGIATIPPEGGYQLYRINRETGATIATLGLKIPDVIAGCTAFRGANGLAASPLTGELFTTLSCGFYTPRFLAIINTVTGVVSVLGNTGDYFSGLAFAPDGTLIGVTGNGGNVPNTLFKISTVDASTTPICRLPDNPGELQGQAIATDTATGILYQASGNPLAGGAQAFASITDLTPTDPLADCNRTDIPLSGDEFVQPGAMTFGGSFLFTDVLASGFSRLFRLSESGETTLLGRLDHVSKGLAFVSGPGKICYKVAKAEGKPGKRDVVVEDLIVGERPARLKLNNPFVVCVPGGVRFVNSGS